MCVCVCGEQGAVEGPATLRNTARPPMLISDPTGVSIIHNSQPGSQHRGGRPTRSSAAPHHTSRSRRLAKLLLRSWKSAKACITPPPPPLSRPLLFVSLVRPGHRSGADYLLPALESSISALLPGHKLRQADKQHALFYT